MSGPLTPRRLREIGPELYGIGWRSVMAKEIGRTKRTVERWADGRHRLPRRLRHWLVGLAVRRIVEIERIASDLDPDFCRRYTDTLVTRETKTS